MGTGKWRDRGIALGIVLTWHVCIVWMMMQASYIAPGESDEDALQVVYIEAPAPKRAPSKRAVRTPVARQRPQSQGKALPIETASLRVVPAASQPEDAQSLSARFLEQGRALAQQQAPIDFAPRDPFANRPRQLPDAAPERFRMKLQRSPANLVAAVGGYLFAPVGYDPDPCPRNRENIGNLVAGHDRKALQQELDFERRHCRP